MKKSYYNLYKKNKETGELLIYNTVSRKLITISDKNDVNFYEFNEFDKLQYRLIESLLKKGILVNEKKDELAELKKNYLFNKADKKHLRITLVPSFLCNFKCPYCFEHKLRSNSKIIDFSVLDKYAYKNFTDINQVHITLFGGEPLLFMNEIVRWCEFVNKLGNLRNFVLTSNIATNGYLLTQKNFTLLIEKCGLKSVQITFEESINKHNLLRNTNNEATFDQIVNNIHELISYKYKHNIFLDIIIRINLLKPNLKEVEELLDRFDYVERNQITIYFRPIYSTSIYEVSSKIDLTKFYALAKSLGFKIYTYDQLRFSHCEADRGNLSYHILPNLNISKCTSESNEEIIGYISQDGEVQNKLDVGFDDECSVFDDEQCSICRFLPFCWGGCPVYYAKNKKRKCFAEKDLDFISLLSRKNNEKN